MHTCAIVGPPMFSFAFPWFRYGRELSAALGTVLDLNPGTSDAAVPYRSALSAQALVLSQSACVGSRLPESVISAANNPAMISFG